MKYVLAIALILAAAIGLAWYRSSAIQADLVEAVEAALVAADAEDVLVSVEGLEVTLAGEVPEAATKERLDRAVAQLPKVGRFINAVEVAATPQPEEAEEVAADDAISLDGCQANLDAILGSGSIDFESSSAELKPTSLSLLDELVVALIQCGEARIEIAGHTDASGPREENLELSLQRAEAVKAYMVAAAVAVDRLTAIGFGPDKPLVDNATPEGRAQNRRIELEVLSP